MPDNINAVTDVFKLVQPDVINRILPQIIYPEKGFYLELFRNGLSVGSIRPSQTDPLTAKRGDILYRVNLGSHVLHITEMLHTLEGYTREYSVDVEFQILDPARFLECYLQNGDPVHLAALDIQKAIQEYGDRNVYEDVHIANIQAKATYAFDKQPDRQKVGLRVVNAYNAVLKEDKSYQPINRSPLLTMNAPLTTRDGYVRDCKLSIELLVIDPRFYRYIEYNGISPLKRAEETIYNTLQSYASQNFYEDIAEEQLFNLAQHVFDPLSDQFTGGLKISYIHHLTLGEDKNYQPIDPGPLLTMNGQLTTREGYVRDYALDVELRVTNYQLYRHLKYVAIEKPPLERASMVIDGEMQRYAHQQFYEDIVDLQLRPVIEHSFAHFTDHVTECLEIVHVHHLTIGEDKSYQPIELSPLLTINGQLTTRENYVRDYTLTVELHVADRWQYLQLTRENVVPLDVAKVAIDGELQRYARQQFYEDLSEAQLITIVEHTLNDQSDLIVGCMKIVRAHRLALKEDRSYRPINLSPLISLNGNLTTKEGYVRRYELTVELLISNRRLYQQLSYEGVVPLEHAKVAIDGELQRYTRQQFYEDLSEAQLITIVEHTYDTLSNRVADGLEIVRAHRFFLGEDRNYKPINLSPLLIVEHVLTTQEGYTRDYKLEVELLIKDQHAYQRLVYEGVDPLERAKVAIDGELQRYARQQFYEDLTEAQLITIVEHTYDTQSNRVADGLEIVRAQRFFLGEDKNYKPVNLSPLLIVEHMLTTQEGYTCDYKLEVELRIKDRRAYQGLIYEGVDPLERASVAIRAELQRYARQKSYEELSHADLKSTVEQAFDELASRVTYDMEVVSAYQFSLEEPAGYVHTGPRTLTITGTLETADNRKRSYEITVGLEVADVAGFVRLTRQGNDPLHFVRNAIEGAILREADGKTHDELSSLELPAAAFKAFSVFADATIAGLRIVEARKAALQVDPHIQEGIEIVQQNEYKKLKVYNDAELDKIENEIKYKISQQIVQQEIELAEQRHIREKNQYLFDLEKKEITDALQFRTDLAQKLQAQLTARISEDLEANVPLADIIEELKAMNSVLQPGIPQNGNGYGGNGHNQLQSGQQTKRQALGAGQSDFQISQITSASSETRRDRKSIPKWGIELVEIALPALLRGLVDDQERAFQVSDIVEDVAETPFLETDIFIKINGKRVYTLEALEAALTAIQPGTEAKVIVLRDEVRKLLILDAPYDVDDQVLHANEAPE